MYLDAWLMAVDNWMDLPELPGSWNCIEWYSSAGIADGADWSDKVRKPTRLKEGHAFLFGLGRGPRVAIDKA